MILISGDQYPEEDSRCTALRLLQVKLLTLPQLSIGVCFVEDGIPCEKFLEFHECHYGVPGEAIASYILSQLSNWQLQPRFMRGQANIMWGLHSKIGCYISHCASLHFLVLVTACPLFPTLNFALSQYWYICLPQYRTTTYQDIPSCSLQFPDVGSCLSLHCVTRSQI